MKKSLLVVLLLSMIAISVYSQAVAVYLNPGKIDAEGVFFDQLLVDVLIDAGYEVETFYSAAATDHLDLMESADLVILARAGSSGDHTNNKATFDAVTKPIINLMPWGWRVANGNWFNATEVIKVLDESVMVAEILEPRDPVFTGVDVSSGQLDWAQGPYDYMDVADAGNGQVLATDAATGTLQFVRFEADVEFYAGCGASPAGPRTFMGNGDDSVGDNINTFNFIDGASLTVFLNEVALLSGKGIVGVSDHILKDISVYTDMASDELHIKNSNNSFQANFYNISGRLVKSVKNAQSIINISDLNNGVYIVKLKNNKGIYTQKFIKY